MLYKNLTRIICIILATSIMSFSGLAVFAQNPNPSTTSTASTTPGEPTALLTEEPETTAVNISANYFEKEDKSYEIIFSSLDYLSELKNFSFKVTVSDAKVTSQAFGEALKTGTYKLSVIGDNSVEFLNGSTETLLSGKLTFCSLFTDVLPTVDKISFTDFTAVDKDGKTITFTPTLTLEEGPVVPELTDKEQSIYDKILALPAVSSLSFYDANAKPIDLTVLSAQISDTVSGYNSLTDAEKKNVAEVLTYNLKNAEGLTTLPPIIKGMENVFDVILLSATLAPITDDDIVNYQFVTDFYASIKDKLSSEGLPADSKVLAEYTDAKTAIEARAAKIAEKQATMSYSAKLEAISKQLEVTKVFSKDKNYKEYLNCLSASAKALYEDIDKNCTEAHAEYKYKKYMLQDLSEKMSAIKAAQNNLASLPEFSTGNIRLQSNYTINVKRSSTVASTATVEVKIYKAENPNKLIDSKTVEFGRGITEIRINMYASKTSYPVANEDIIVSLSYTVDDITYELGSETVTCGRQAASAPSGGLPSGITGSSPSSSEDDNDQPPTSGTIYPTVDEDDEDENPESTEPTSLFTDIGKYGWAKEAIEGLYYAGIVNGMEDGIYNPAGNVTREQFCKMVVQLFGVLDYNEFNNKFTDINKNAWYLPYINSAIKSGYVQGQSDDYFGIGESIMRQDMATILYRALGSKGKAIEISFSDNDAIADYAKEAISEFCGLELLNGYEDGSFNPRGTTTRAEAAKVIWGVYNIIND